jgi:hypothetical protein
MKYLLLLAPCVLAVLTPLYNHLAPELFGFPLFYWFLLLMIPVSALCIWLADRVSASER